PPSRRELALSLCHRGATHEGKDRVGEGVCQLCQFRWIYRECSRMFAVTGPSPAAEVGKVGSDTSAQARARVCRMCRNPTRQRGCEAIEGGERIHLQLQSQKGCCRTGFFRSDEVAKAPFVGISRM